MRLSGALGLAHGLSDAAAGWLLAACGGAGDAGSTALLLLLYNGLAFGGQPVAGLAVDGLRAWRPAAALSLTAMAVALLLGPSLAGVLLAGLASCVFHVAAGALAARSGPGAGGLGLFAAPGVLGLVAGGAAGAAGLPPTLLAASLLAASAAPLLLAAPEAEEAPAHAGWEPHDAVMVVLLAAVALRSALWTGLQVVASGDLPMLALLACAAAAGKLGGGLAADRLGLRRWSLGALAAAAPLLAFGAAHPASLALGVALLQSTTPAFLRASVSLFPARPGFASGLVLGLAVALGGLPALAGAGALGPGLMLVLTLLALGATARALQPCR